MKITDLLLEELDREAVGIRKTLERVPEGKNNWKPHEKSAAFLQWCGGVPAKCWRVRSTQTWQ